MLVINQVEQIESLVKRLMQPNKLFIKITIVYSTLIIPIAQCSLKGANIARFLGFSSCNDDICYPIPFGREAVAG